MKMLPEPRNISSLVLCFLLLFAVSESASAPMILVFGDSTVDPGNNNYIMTAFKSNFWPYGKDFVNHTATGRFTNGRLPTDFIAEYLGIKDYVPPYLDRSLSLEELNTGVSFASAGSGYDPLTPRISNVISLTEQLNHFKDYKRVLEASIGEEKTRELISEAVFIISAGTNDFVVNYFTIPIRRQIYTVQGYASFLLENSRRFLQELVDEGANRIGVAGLPPMGCVPIVITRYSGDPVNKRGCIESFCTLARSYNQMLQNELSSMQGRFRQSKSRFVYLDIYKSVEALILGHKNGIEKVSVGCCGTGLLEASFFCNTGSPVCSDTSKYVFWDSVHPTETTYELVVQTLHPMLDLLVSN